MRENAAEEHRSIVVLVRCYMSTLHGSMGIAWLVSTDCDSFELGPFSNVYPVTAG